MRTERIASSVLPFTVIVCIPPPVVALAVASAPPTSSDSLAETCFPVLNRYARSSASDSAAKTDCFDCCRFLAICTCERIGETSPTITVVRMAVKRMTTAIKTCPASSAVFSFAFLVFRKMLHALMLFTKNSKLKTENFCILLIEIRSAQHRGAIEILRSVARRGPALDRHLYFYGARESGGDRGEI